MGGRDERRLNKNDGCESKRCVLNTVGQDTRKRNETEAQEWSTGTQPALLYYSGLISEGETSRRRLHDEVDWLALGSFFCDCVAFRLHHIVYQPHSGSRSDREHTRGNLLLGK